VGTVFMLARLWDVLTDVVMGTLSDRVRTRLGRRRPLILASVPILVVCVLALFMPPDGVGVVYLLAWLVALYVGWTMLTISHMAWAAELSTDYHTRSRLQAWRELALVGGMVFVLALPAVIEQRVGGGGATRAAAMGWFILALLPITVGLATWRVPETMPEDEPGAERPPKTSAWRAIKVAAENPLMLRVLGADLLAGIAPGVTAALYVFFVEHAMGMGAHTSVLLLTYFVSGFISVPIWLRLSYRFGKHRTFSIAMIYGAAALPLVLFLGPGDLVLYTIANIVYGLGYGAAPVLLRSITADVTDDDQLRTGEQRTGLFYSLLALTNKLGFAIAVGVSYPLLDMVGFDPHTESSASAIAGLKAIYIGVPVVCFVLAAALMWRFPLDRGAQARLREQLRTSAPPVT
jgi:Na+/melibiose symporter-like transporter